MPKAINISASRGASILTYYDKRLDARRSMSKWRTPVQTWLEIKENREPGFCEFNKYEYPVFEETPAIRWGKAFESAIIELAENKSESNIIDRERFYEVSKKGKKRKNGIITCHIDGKHVWRGGKKYCLHEGKTTSYFFWKDHFGDPGSDRVPIEYQVQCQHQMICTGAEKVILSVLVWPRRVEDWEEMGWTVHKNESGKYELYLNDELDFHQDPIEWAEFLDQMGYFHQYEIHANLELQNIMIADYTEWWKRFIIGNEVPEPTHYNDIRALVTEPQGTIIASEEVISLMEEYKMIKNEIKGSGPLAQRAEMIKVGVLDYMRKAGADAVDDDSTDKFILRDKTGKKLATYGKNKNGSFYFK